MVVSTRDQNGRPSIKMDLKSGLPEPPRNPRETAQYIEALTKDLRRLAAAADLGFLAYLLAMVEDDAGATARRLGQGDAA